MDAEEYEQIPWSNLVAEAQPSVDKRVYVAGVVVAVIVVVFIGARAFGGGSAADVVPLDSAPVNGVVAPVDEAPASDIAQDAIIPGSDAVADSGAQLLGAGFPASPIGGVSEADLMAGVGEPVVASIEIPTLIAEWFVTDFFTRDGSAETVASLEAVLATNEVATDLPHHEHDGFDAFVEWARTFAFVDSGSSIEFSVAYRTVHEEDGGFVRDPVRAVSVVLVEGPSGWVVAALPVEIDLP